MSRCEPCWRQECELAEPCTRTHDKAKKKIGILISGRGSNMAALIEAARAPDYPAEIALVISNKATAAGLERAKAAGIETLVIDHKGFTSREAFDDAVHAALVAAGVELVALAGFMRIQSAGFVDRWLGRQLNIHPSLLPSFKGLHPHKQALDAGVRVTGATVHFVTHELDGGPIVAQAAVPVLDGDTVEALESPHPGGRAPPLSTRGASRRLRRGPPERRPRCNLLRNRRNP